MAIYATIVPDDVVKQSGSLTRFPTAVHREHVRCLEAAREIRDDFASRVNADFDAKTIGNYPVLGSVHVVAFTIPDCLPERLAVMTKLTDFTTLNDDYYEAAGTSEVEAFNVELQRSLGAEIPNEAVAKGEHVAVKTKQYQASILVEMMRIDRGLAIDVMNTYSNALEMATFPPSNISSLAEYLPIRLMNCGLEYGVENPLHKEEKANLSEITNAALYSATLINDCHSWPKELQYHLETPGSEIPFNAVSILMRQNHCSDSEAIKKLREEYVELQERHLAMVSKLEQNKGPIPDVHHKYIMAAQYTASGSEFWSIYAPRYPSKEDLNQPECMLVSGVFRWVSPLPTGNAKNGSAIFVNGVDAAEPLVTGVPMVPPATEATDRRTGEVNGETQISNNHSVVANRSSSGTRGLLKKPSQDAVQAPYDYVRKLPSKKVRETFIDALDSWLEVPIASLAVIKSVIGMLHHSSLMLEDIEDNSALRRGNPTAHTLFGTSQTINSANYVFVCAFEQIQQLRSPDAATVFIEELKNLHCGQALDLHWKYHTHVPTIDEYFTMVDHKTGGLFRLCVRLMQVESGTESVHIDSGRFITLLGRFFQIRDDYQNLVSGEYASQKGFCEDLDEGKISLPLIFCLAGSDPEQIMIKGILQHKGEGEMPIRLKKVILEKMRKAGALDSTFSLLQELQQDILEELSLLETAFGSENPILELLLRRLWI